MNDSRWDDILWSADSAVRHFKLALEVFDQGEVGTGDRAAAKAEMAFMHAMQSGYTSFEAAIIRTMALLGEERPTGSDWHKQLAERAAREQLGVRPPIIPPELLAVARRVRSFRHWAMHGYDEPFVRRKQARRSRRHAS